MSHAPTYKEIPFGPEMEANQTLTGSWRVQRPVVNDKCTKCGLCVMYCPDASIEKTDNGIKFNLDFCKGCGICENECPLRAITMVREEG